MPGAIELSDFAEGRRERTAFALEIFHEVMENVLDKNTRRSRGKKESARTI